MKKSVALTTIVALHAAVIGILLIQAGCNSTNEAQQPKAETLIENEANKKNDYSFKIYPIIQSSAKILANSGVKRLGVFATKATINSNAYENEIKKYNSDMEIFSMACPGWVEIVESNAQDKSESVALVKEQLEKMMNNSPEKIVLGCTHYPFLSGILTRYVSSGMLIDPAEDFAKFIKADLEKKNLNNLQNKLGKEDFYVSANPEQFKVSGSLFYSIKDVPELV